VAKIIFLETIVSVSIVFFFICYGGSMVDTNNWSEFFPNSYAGVFTGARILFFSILGFDGVITFAEEVENPVKDIPFVILSSISICGVLYCLVGLIFTGLIPINDIVNKSITLNQVFFHEHSDWAGYLISTGALMSLLTGMQICQMSVTRVLFAMSRDGLLPKFFSSLHSKSNEPYISTLFAGGVIILLTLFLSPDLGLIDVVCIGTLLTFTIVNTGVLKLREKVPEAPSSDKLRYYLLLYIIGSLIVGFLSKYLLDYIAIGLAILFIPFILICYHFYRYLPYPIVFTKRNFLTPLVPLVPLVGITTNIYFIISVDGQWGIYIFVMWLVIGMILYVFYSMRYSIERRQSFLSENVPLIRSSYD